MNAGLGFLVRGKDCKFCGVLHWSFSVVTTPPPALVYPQVVHGRQPALPWEYVTVGAYLVRTGPSSHPENDVHWSFGTFEGGYQDSAGTKTVAGTWDCPFVPWDDENRPYTDYYTYIAGGGGPAFVVAAGGGSFLFSTKPGPSNYGGIEAGVISQQMTAANLAAAQAAADAENAARLAAAGQSGQYAVITFWPSESTYTQLTSNTATVINGVSLDEANCLFKVYGNNFQLIDTIDPFA